MNSQFSGINPAFYACYDESGNVSAERTEALAMHLLKEGVQGLYVGGSSDDFNQKRFNQPYLYHKSQILS